MSRFQSDQAGSPRSRTLRRFALAVMVGTAMAEGGCVVSEKGGVTTGPYIASERERTPTSSGSETGRPFDPVENPGGRSVTLHVRAGLLPMGSVPYDGFVLPLVSPDGRYVATHTGSPPTWPMVLAESDASPPYATSVEIYRLDNRQTIPPTERKLPERIAKVEGFVLLGRGVDDAGFLIEAPQEDGSRWIGRAAWESGEVEWLVQDDSINAFAAISPEGRLAWSRRTLDQERFDLAIRDIDGTQWTVPANGGDWLMPVWSTLSNGVYALHRQDSTLRLCYGQANGIRAFEASLRDFVLMASSDKYAAYQAFISQGSTDAAPLHTRGSVQPQTLVLHPGLGRMILWKPFASRDQAATLLNPRSLSAVQQSEDAVIISLRDELILQSLRDPDASIPLSPGTCVPQRTRSWDCPYVLLAPSGGLVNITALKLLPADTAAALPAP